MKKRSLAGNVSHHYVAKAGHLAAMAELAWRGYNVAIPEIDVGDDVFVTNNTTGAMWRLQVKTASPKTQKRSISFAFKVRQSSIDLSQSPDLHFVFAMRMGNAWRFLVMNREVLRTDVNRYKIGTPCDSGAYRRLDIVMHNDLRAVCAKVDWSSHLEDWATWPVISKTPKTRHPPAGNLSSR